MKITRVITHKHVIKTIEKPVVQVGAAAIFLFTLREKSLSITWESLINFFFFQYINNAYVHIQMFSDLPQ